MDERKHMLDDKLEELYLLLDLYFDHYRISEGFVKASGDCTDAEPQLDTVIFKENLLERIRNVSQELHAL